MKPACVFVSVGLALAGLLLLFPASAVADGCFPPPAGLIGWWPGNGNANDIIGTNNGILSSSGATYAPAMVGMGFRLDGTNGFVEIPYSTVLEPSNLTLEAWVWLDPSVNTNPPVNESIIFKQNTWSYYFEGYSLLKASIENPDGTYTDHFQFVVSNNGDQVVINSVTVVQRGVWYHVAATYDGNQSMLYVNGVAEASAIAGFQLDYGTEPVYFGTTGTPAPYTDMLAGIIDAPSIYDRALSSNEIAGIYEAGSAGKCNTLAAPPVIMGEPTNETVEAGGTATFSVNATATTPLAYQWYLNNDSIAGATNSTLSVTNVQVDQSGSVYFVMVSDEGGSTNSAPALLTVSSAPCDPAPSGLIGWWPGDGNANDVIGTNNGILSSSGATYAPAMVGMGFRLDGTNGYVEIPYSTVLEPSNLTLEAWVWLDPSVNTNSPVDEAIIFKQNTWPYDFEGYTISKDSIENPDGTFTDHFQFVVSRDGDQVILNSVTVAQRGVWYHVAGTYDGNQSILYINGVAEASAMAGFPLDYGTEPVYFGTTGTPAPYTDMLAGIIDAPSIYDRALASNEIAGIYEAGSAGKCLPPLPPTIESQTPSQIVLLSNAVTLSVSASGTEPLSYYWSQNGAAIPSATNASYTFTAQLSDSGSTFSCLVSNAYGTAVSTNVLLKVLDTVSNDLCSGAVVITSFSYTNEQSTLDASSDGDPVPDCVEGFGNGVWYEFTAPVSGQLYVDTFGSDFDTGLAAYTGSCDSLTEVACNDDTGGVTSQVIVPATAGTTYYFLAGGYEGHTGDLMFHLNFLTPPLFVTEPTNLAVVVSSNAVFSPTVAGAQPISYQWYFNNAPLTDGGRVSGSMTSTLTLTNVQTTDGGNYELVASNYLGTATSSVAVLTPIILPPVFIQAPTNEAAPQGSNVTFTAVVSGTPPFSYQWTFNGTPLTDDGVHIFGSATSSLSISNLTLADAGDYSLTVTNVSGMVGAAVVLTVETPPVISAQPVGRSVPPGLPTVFSATVSGSPPGDYQWELDGTNIPGATSLSYTNPAVGSNDLGYYQLVASNFLGSITSAPAQLTFGPVAAWGDNTSGECLPPPGLTNVIAVGGGSGVSDAVGANGTIAAWGSGLITYQMSDETDAVAVSISADSTIATVLRADGTTHYDEAGHPVLLIPVFTNIVAVATGGNEFGYALRAEGTLEGWGASSFTNTPVNLDHVAAVTCGLSHTLALREDGTVAAWGSGPATNVPAGLTNIAAIAAGYSHSLALSSNGTVIAWGSGTGTNLPAGLTNIAAIAASYTGQGQSLSLAVRSNGTVVAWGDNPYGETNPPSALTNLLTVAIGAAPYHGLALVNDGSPYILHPPVGLTAYTGRTVTLQAGAVGAAPLSYQWLLNGTNLPGATNTSLVLSNVQFSNAGNYQLQVSNSINTALSLPAPVNVISNGTLTFLSQPSGFQTNFQGSKVTFGVTVLGSGPLSYQWYTSADNKIFTPVAGATNELLVFDPALAIQSGYYQCVVSNQFGAVTSTPIYLRVLFAKAWGYLATDPPFNLTNAVAIAVGNYGSGSLSGDYLALSAAGKISNWSGGPVLYGETNFSALSNSIVTAIAAGYGDTLALKSDGTVFAAGFGIYGITNVPPTVNGITAIACGDYHDLALNYEGTVIGWGQNLEGQATNAAATNVVAIAAGGESSMALRADGSVITWGLEAGLGYPVPTTVSNIVSIACGNGFYLALRTNGTVVAWGNGSAGQTSIPANWTNIVAISAGATHATALRTDGTVVSVGIDSVASAVTNIPPNLANVIAIASSGDRDLALFGTRTPAFTVQPWSRTIYTTNTTVWFCGKCAGVQPIHYQWQLNGTNILAATNDTLTLGAHSPLLPPLLQTGNVFPGVYQLIASNAYGVVASKYAQLTVLIPLGTALNATNLNWTTGGDAQWFGETNVTHDGVSAAQSGDIGQDQESDLLTTLVTNYSGDITFWWQVSSEPDFDFLEFRINGLVQTNISGAVNWQQVSIHVPAGTNLLEWRFYQTSPFASGADAGWVDQFAFVADPPIIGVQPVSQVVNVGTNVTFSITVINPVSGSSGGPGPEPRLSYQWWQNGSVVSYAGPSLTLGNVGRAQDGTYYEKVTDLITGESTVSSNATLLVLVPQLLGTPTVLPNGSFQLMSGDIDGGQIPAVDLTNFVAQVSTNLVNWTTLTNGLSLTNGMLLLQDSGSSNSPARFYRIVEQ